jgi:hypothetical protein
MSLLNTRNGMWNAKLLAGYRNTFLLTMVDMCGMAEEKAVYQKIIE